MLWSIGIGWRVSGWSSLQAAPAAQGRRIVVVDAGETADDLVRDMIEVLTSMCARGCMGGAARVIAALRAVTATRQQPEPAEAAG